MLRIYKDKKGLIVFIAIGILSEKKVNYYKETNLNEFLSDTSYISVEVNLYKAL